MKAKILSYGLLASMALIGTTSCTDLLDKSYGSIVSSQYNPKTEADISYLINAAYVPWRETMLLWDGVVRSQELCADQDVIPARDGVGWVDGYIYKRWHQHKWTTEDDGVLQGWERTYSGITTCNRLLSQIEDDEINVQGDQKENLMAELKVLRASYYYILIDLYGNVPLATDFKDTSLPQQSTRQQVFDFIVSEINENLDRLSEIPRNYYYGRMNKWVAHTLLAKMYLNSEVWTGTAQWQKCIDECDQVIKFAEETGSYGLEANQKDVFKTDNENSKEIIFALPFDAIYVTDWNAFDFHLYTLTPEHQETYKFQQRPWGGVCHIPQFVNSFDKDDIRWQENMIYGPQYTTLGGNEPLQCSDGSGDMILTNEVPSIDSSTPYQGYRWGKFEYAIGSNNVLDNDFPVFRYADVLMMKAESLMRLGQSGAGSLVTKVRERAFKNAPEKAQVTDADLIKGSVYDYGRRDTYSATYEGGDDIRYGRFLDELGWEFMQEGHRRQDMIRFGVFTTKSWFSHDKSDETKKLYPIPSAAMLTNSNLKQNPGYSK